MAYRKIHDNFWTDPDIEELTPEQKYFYLYLLTNPSVNQIGIYELSIKRACFETGYNSETVNKLLCFFEKYGKVLRSENSKEILIVKFYHHNLSKSPKVKKHVEELINNVKDKDLIQYIYSMDTVSNAVDTVSQEEEEKEKEEEEAISAIPSLSEVRSYFSENGYDSDIGEKAFNIYQASLEDHPQRKIWRDSRDNPIKNWKLKMQSVWFKEENKFDGDHLKDNSKYRGVTNA